MEIGKQQRLALMYEAQQQWQFNGLGHLTVEEMMIFHCWIRDKEYEYMTNPPSIKRGMQE